MPQEPVSIAPIVAANQASQSPIESEKDKKGEPYSYLGGAISQDPEKLIPPKPKAPKPPEGWDKPSYGMVRKGRKV